jgi:F-type H+-transporting ATPase subunit gamma
MPSLIDIRRRIRSVKNTQQITKAMKMMSAARLRRAQERVYSARPYARLMRTMLGSLVSRLETARAGEDAGPRHPLLARRPAQRVLLVVLGGDKGLAGAFNTNVHKTAAAYLREHAGRDIAMIAVGKKPRDFFRRRRALLAEFPDVFARVSYATARDIGTKIIERYTAAESPADQVVLIYNEFKSVLTQRLVTETLLPLEPVAPAPGESKVDYIYEQGPEELLGTILPRYVEVQVFRCLLESAASEHAARMTAMDKASNSAAEMIDKLTLNMNRIRQAGITREIIEIVSGAAALG